MFGWAVFLFDILEHVKDLLKQLYKLQRPPVRTFSPDGRSCEECAFVNMDNNSPSVYTCWLDEERVQRDAYCHVFVNWLTVGERDLPTSAHEKATLLAQKVATYTSLI